mmetsp:Transcript_17484/g.24303  ORF Transcript_17484/g.24303 Transcript_17484/m.24303 type:complete len:138 (-) Transcript_17484:59-472(-)
MMKSARSLLRTQSVVQSRRINCCCRSSVRSFGSTAESEKEDGKSGSSSNQEWRKVQLGKIAKKFQDPLQIDNYEDVQPMWKEMESRVTKRRTLTLAQRGGKSGRMNIRKTEEEAWLQAGLYDTKESDDNENSKDGKS